MYRCTDVQMYRCTDTQIYRCIYATQRLVIGVQDAQRYMRTCIHADTHTCICTRVHTNTDTTTYAHVRAVTTTTTTPTSHRHSRCMVMCAIHPPVFYSAHREYEPQRQLKKLHDALEMNNVPQTFFDGKKNNWRFRTVPKTALVYIYTCIHVGACSNVLLPISHTYTHMRYGIVHIIVTMCVKCSPLSKWQGWTAQLKADGDLHSGQRHNAKRARLEQIKTNHLGYACDYFVSAPDTHNTIPIAHISSSCTSSL
jgi:hypothetical protein